MKNLYLLLLLLMAGQAFSQPVVLTLKPAAEGKDAMVSSYSPDNNYATYAGLCSNKWTISSQPYAMRGFIQFDLSGVPAGATIVEASINLYFAAVGGMDGHANTSGSNESFLQRVTESWDEATITWNNQPEVVATNQVVLPNSISPTQDYLGVDVTTLIADMLTNGNYGMMLRLGEESHYRRMTFASGDYSDAAKHPELIIKYTTEPGSAPAAATGIAATEDSPLSIALQWTDNATNEGSYIVERSVENPTNFSAIQTLAQNTTSAVITDGILNKTRYFFRIKAVDPNGYYSYSSIVSVITGGIAMNDGDKTVCNAFHFDSGVNNPYSSLENYTQVLTPATVGKRLKFSLSTLSLSGGDYFRIYDGSSTGSELIYELTGSTIPAEPIVATNSEGKLTLHFTSKDDVSKANGWEAYITCVNPIYAPHNIEVLQADASSIGITWADTIASELGFEIQRSVNGGSYATLTTTDANATSYTDNLNIASGVNYCYRIRTKSADNTSSWSTPVCVTSQGPVAPSGLVVVSNSSTEVVVTWIDNSDNEEKFVVERSLSPTEGFAVVAQPTANSTTHTDTDVLPNTLYYYRIKSVSGDYNSLYTPTKGVIAGAVVMGNKSVTGCNFYLLDSGGLDNYSNNEDYTLVILPSEVDKRVKITFEEFDLDYGADKIEVYDGESTSADLLKTITDEGSSVMPEAVQASNSTGALTLRFVSNSSYSYAGFKIQVSCVTPPPAPTGLVVSAPTVSSLTVSWDNTLVDETAVDVYKSETVDGVFAKVGSAAADATEYTVTGLASGSTYFIKVRAVYAAGASDFTSTLEGTTSGPKSPTLLTVASPSANEITLTWADNSSNETAFVVERSLNSSSDFVQVASLDANTTTYTDNTLDYGTVYYYRVQAQVDAIKSEYSQTRGFMAGAVIMDGGNTDRCDYILLDPGGAGDYSNNLNKTMVLSPSVVGNIVKLTFDAFNLESGWDYLYIHDGENTSAPQLAKLSGTTVPTSSYLPTNPQGILTLRFTSDGSGTRAGFKAQVSCILVPAAPTGLSQSDATLTSLTISWVDNSTNETMFHIYRSSTEGGTYTKVGEVAENVTEFTDTGLTSETVYYYKVMAVGTDVSSPLSAAFAAATAGLTQPTGLALQSPSSTSMVVSWTDNSTVETGFRIERSLNSSTGFETVGTVGVDIATYTDETVSYNTTYYYRVCALGDGTQSAYTTPLGFTAGALVMYEGNIERCGFILLDPGGIGNYPDNQDITFTIKPTEPGKFVKLVLDALTIESEQDKLDIYNGLTTADPLLASLSGNIYSFDSFIGRNPSGALTLRFTSDGSLNLSGFKAMVNCIDLPAAPSGLDKFAVGISSVFLGWTDNSTNETGFQIFQSQTLDGTYQKVGEVSADVIDYTCTGLASATTYFFKVVAVGSDGNSDFSNTVEVKTQGLVPPSSLSLESPTNTSIVLQWADNSDQETAYVVERSLQPSTGFTTIATLDANAVTYTDNSVTYQTTYYYRVYAQADANLSTPSEVNGLIAGSVIMSNTTLSRCDFILLDPGGLSNYSDNENKTLVLTPSVPEGRVRLSFQSFNTQSGFDNLKIYNGKTVSDPLFFDFSGSVAPTQIYTATNADGALTLEFTSNGSVNNSGFVAHSTCIQIPFAPSSLSQQSATNSSITLSWTDNSSVEEGFSIHRSESSSGSYYKIGEVGANTTQFADANLTSATEYFYMVRADGAEGNSPFTSVLSASTIGLGAPSNLAITSPTNESIVLAWLDNSADETGFVLERSVEGANFEVLTTVSANQATYTDNSVEYGVSYSYRVKAVSSDYESTYSNLAETIAGAVVMSNATITRCDYILLDSGGLAPYPTSTNTTTVLNPAQTGAMVEINFEQFSLASDDNLFIYNGANNLAPQLAVLTGSSIATTRYIASNPSGQLTLHFLSTVANTSSGFKASVTCITAPNAPTGLQQKQSDHSSITLEWTDNSTNETKFEVYRSTSATGTFTKVGEVATDVAQFTDEGLNIETNYYYKVRAASANFESTFTDVLEATTAGALAPSMLVASSTDDNSIALTWVDNSGQETGYVIERSLLADQGFTTLATVGANEVNYTDSDTEYGSTFYYRVSAKNGDFISTPTNVAGYLAGSVLIDNTTITRCNYFLLDPGGVGNYSLNQSKTVVLKPVVAGTFVKLDLTSYSLDSGFDRLKIFDGTSTSAYLMDIVSGLSLVAKSYVATNPEGALTVVFTSDDSNVGVGFVSTVSCVTPPAVPTGLTQLESATGAVTFSWNDSSDDEVGFEVFFSLQPDGVYTKLAETDENVNTYTHSGLGVEREYYYKVRAVSSMTVSAYSEVLSAISGGILAPTNLSASSPESDAVVLTWTDNSNQETAYVISRAVVGTDNYETLATLDANSTTYTDITAVFNVSYYYRVTGTNKLSESNYNEVKFTAGNVLFSTTTLTRCNYYIVPSINSWWFGNSRDEVMVLAPTMEGTKVKILIELLVLESGNDLLYIYDGTDTSAPLLAALTGDKKPTEPFIATNETGMLTLRFVSNETQDYGNFKALVSCVEVPTAPSNLAKKESTSNSVTLTWTDNSPNEVRFEVFRRSESQTQFAWVADVEANLTEYKNNNLESGTTYYYKVRSVTSDAHSPFSNELEALTDGLKAPSGLSVSSPGNESLLITWTDNATNETGYVVERSQIYSFGYEVVATLAANTISYTDQNLEFGEEYFYRVKAVGEGAESDYTDYASYIPGALNMTSTSLTKCNYILLDPGGTSYYGNNLDVEMVLSPTEAGKMVRMEFSVVSIEFKFDSLIIHNGSGTDAPLLAALTGWDLPAQVVQADNSTGELTLRFVSDGSSYEKGFKALVRCVDHIEAPSSLVAKAVAYGSVTLGWTDNSSNEEKFEVFRSATINGNFIKVGEVAANVTEFTDSPLNSQTSYFYKVRAALSDTESLFTEVLSVQTQGLSAPTNLAVTSPASSQLKLTWTDNSTDETGFIVERSLSETEGFEVITTTAADAVSYIDETVEFGETYFYRIYAVGSGTRSSYSETASFIAGAIIMSSTTYSGCGYILLDSGGMGNYSLNEDITMVLLPNGEGRVKIDISEFNLENSYDKLYIYNGLSTSAPLLANLSGTQGVGVSFTAHNADRALTLRFTSDNSDVLSGFNILVNCVETISAPSNLALDAVTDTKVTLSWTDNADNEDGFKLFRSLSREVDFVEVASLNGNVTSYVDEATPNTTYFYKVQAFNSYSQSLFSSTLEVKTNVNSTPADSFLAQLVMYPNPARGKVTINLASSEVGALTLEVLSTSGNRINVYSSQKVSEELSLPIDVSHLVEGVYLVRITLKGKTATAKLIVN